MDSFEIGDEAILDMTDFSLEGRAMKDVRQSVSRMQRRGYTLRAVRHSTLAAADFAALETAAAKWRGDGGDERGFSMALGRLGDPLDGDCVLVEAYDADEQLRGFLSFVPWGRNGLSLDLMRRDPDGRQRPGRADGLVVGRPGGGAGCGPVSLNFAMFREAFERGPSRRRGSDRPAVASRAAAWQQQLAAGVPLPLEREVLPGVAAALHLLRVHLGPAAGRHRRGQRRGLPRPPRCRCLSRGKEQRAGAMDRAGDDYAAAVAALIPAEADPLEAALSVDGLPEQVRVRRAKLDRLREQGIDPYPVAAPARTRWPRSATQPGTLGPGQRTGVTVSVVGRVMLKRDGGKLCFATLRDGCGDLQVMLSLADGGPGAAGPLEARRRPRRPCRRSPVRS